MFEDWIVGPLTIYSRCVAASLPQEKPPSINPELVKQEIIGHHQDPSDHLSEDEEEDDDFQPTKRKKVLSTFTYLKEWINTKQYLSDVTEG